MPRAAVSLVVHGNGLANIPQSWVTLILEGNSNIQQMALKCTPINQIGQSTLFIGWEGGSTLQKNGQDTLEMDIQLALANGLNDGDLIDVEVVQISAVAKNISVEPCSIDDWEIVELNADFLESQFLNQYRFVCLGQILSLYINNIIIRLKVTGVDPEFEHCLRLDSTSEVIICPRPRPARNEQNRKSYILKAYPGEWLDIETSVVDSIGLPDIVGLDASVVYIQNMEYSHLMEIDSQNNETPRKAPVLGICANVYHQSISPHAVIHKELAVQLGIQPFSKIRCTGVAATAKIPHTVTIQTFASNLSVDEIISLTMDVIKTVEGYIFPGMFVKINSSTYGRLLIDRDQQPTIASDILAIPQFARIPIASLKKLRILHQSSQTDFEIKSMNEAYSNLCSIMPGYENRLAILIKSLESRILSTAAYPLEKPGGLLVYGADGSGKTSALNAIGSLIAKKYQLYYVRIECRKLNTLGTESVKKVLQRFVNEAVWNQPSLMVLDDLDILLPAEAETPSTRVKRLSHYLINIFSKAASSHDIFWTATGREKFGIHDSVRFEEYYNLTEPNKDERVAVLKHLIGIDSREFNFEELSTLLDGYNLSDVVRLTQIAKNLFKNRNHAKFPWSEIISIADFKDAMSRFKPTAISAAGVLESSVQYSTIGGMFNIKKELIKIMKFPALYPQIFSNSPLRLQSGILLYGYPGCGKTMIASAVAKECSLNFISVKGPELLNKYIGASEKSVRDVFNRARSARPCLLFFDEFDSIAPRRGHDNSGVTDRVVNQILTEMDGAEGLDGVFVLAATSRPDMIDPALLRPGRLDKSIFVDFPDENDRLDIIRKITQKIPLEKSISKLKIAQKTEGFSGADLQALLYTAQLAAINAELRNSKIVVDVPKELIFKIIQGDITLIETKNLLIHEEKGDIPRDPANSEPVIVSNLHLESAFKETAPSLRASEYSKFQLIFERFENKRVGPHDVGKKSTFA